MPQEIGAAWGREPPLRLAGGPALLGPASCSTVVWVLLLIELLGEEMGVEVRPPVTSEILVVAHWIREFFADPLGMLLLLNRQNVNQVSKIQELKR